MEALDKPLLLPAGRRLGLWLQLSFWMLFMVINILVLTGFYGPEAAFMRGLVNLFPLMALFYGNVWLVNRFFERGRIFWYVLTAIASILLISWVRVRINLLFPDLGRELTTLSKQQVLQIGAWLTSSLVLLLSTFSTLIENRNRRERLRQRAREEEQAARLQFLRAQINPHFLFNTLHNIYSLAVTRSEKTAPMVMKLSELLRYVIYDSRQEMVDLSREVRQLEKYIDLFQMRSEHPLDIVFECQGDPSGRKVEPMLLLPLVENCFKHCDFDRNPKAFVRLKLVVNSKGWSFATRNSFDPADQQKDRVGGVGLENIRRRLELKYPDQFNLDIRIEDRTFSLDLEFKQS